MNKQIDLPRRMDFKYVPEWREEALSSLTDIRPGTQLTIDAQKTEFIDSTGIGSLIMIAREAQSRKISVRVIHINSKMRATLEMAHLGTLMALEY